VKEIADNIGLHRANVSTLLSELAGRGIVSKKPAGVGFFYSFNEHEEQWKERPARSGKRSKTTTSKESPAKGNECSKNATQNQKFPRMKITTSPYENDYTRVLNQLHQKPAKSSGARVSRTVKKVERKEKEKEQRDPLDFDMTPTEAEKVMAHSLEARELAKLFWDESKRRGATGFPDGFFWKCVVCFDKLLKRGSKDQIAACMLDLFDDGFTIMDSPHKVSDKFAAWQMRQKSGGWKKWGDKTPGKPADPPSRPTPDVWNIEDQPWFPGNEKKEIRS
jgi:hypothetical protein